MARVVDADVVVGVSFVDIGMQGGTDTHVLSCFFFRATVMHVMIGLNGVRLLALMCLGCPSLPLTFSFCAYLV